MDRQYKMLLVGVVASGVIAPIIAVINRNLIKKIEEKKIKR